MIFREFVDDVVSSVILKAGLSGYRFAKLVENKDEFCRCIVASIRECSARNRFNREEIDSHRDYPLDYHPRDIAEQIARLLELFPGLRYEGGNTGWKHVPNNCEGWFAIPRWESIAPTYGDAVRVVLRLISSVRGGKFYCQYERFSQRYLRQHWGTAKALGVIGNQQEYGDILVIPGQLGRRHRGRSVRRVREVMGSCEFGLGTFAIGIIILTHPDRISSYADLGIDCAGDEFSPSTNGDFSFVPYFVSHNGKIKLIMRRHDRAYECLGSASAILMSSKR